LWAGAVSMGIEADYSLAIWGSTIDRGDVLEDPELVARLLGAPDLLVAHRVESASAA
jgi:hypothetical protein